MAAISPSSHYSPPHLESNTETSLGDACDQDGLTAPEHSAFGSVHVNLTQADTRIDDTSQSQPRDHSSRRSLVMDSNKLPGCCYLQEMEETDLAVSTVHTNEHIVEGTVQTGEQPVLEVPVDSPPSSSEAAVPLLTLSVSSPYHSVPNDFSLDPDSESDIDGEHVLQRSSSVDSTSPPQSSHNEVSEFENDQQSSPILRISPCNSETLAFTEPSLEPASQLPDLVSFGLSTSPRPRSSQQTTATLHDSCTPSCATVDDLLSLSPLQSSSSSILIPPSSQPQGCQAEGPEIAKDVATASSLSFNTEAIPQECQSRRAQQPSAALSNMDEPTHSRELSPMKGQHDLIQCETKPIATPDETKAADMGATSAMPASNADVEASTPRKIKNSTAFNPTGETRKRSPMKTIKGKERALESNRSAGDLPSSMPDDLKNFETIGDSDPDKTVKKERRNKAKLRDVERTRQQLLSLSPTSAGVLSLLASPERSDFSIPNSRFGIDTTRSELANVSDAAAGSLPDAPSMAHVLTSSPRRSQNTPLRFVSPAPISLDDPNRTPARRILVSPARPRPLPLDDPSRIPARRVPVIKSPDKLANVKGLPIPKLRFQRSSPMRQGDSPSKLAVIPTPSSHDIAASSQSAPSPTKSRLAKPLPFPIQSNATLNDLSSTSSIPSYRQVTESAHGKNVLPSNLRQSSAVIASKISRAVTKPYLRPSQGSTRLPTAASVQHPVSTTSNEASTVTTDDVVKPITQPSQANLVSSRIPSPVKRPALSAESLGDVLAIASPSASTSALASTNELRTNTAKRKRRRMIEEDEADEPPTKRSVIMVRPVVKGMFSNALARNRVVDDSSTAATTEKDASPIRISRPPGHVHFRPVIPGTLRHFETKRSSSKNLFKEKEETSEVNVLSPDLPSVPVSGPSRHESPVIETDTASTVTTLSREPTLEDLSGSSNVPRSETLVLNSRDLGPRTTRSKNTRLLTTNPTSKRNHSTTTLTAPHCKTTVSSLASTKAPARSTTPTGGIPTNPKQLQTLTEANTRHNQAYIANLYRKVVRKHGPRPASPTTKVRTILEKSKEERAKEREARAARRRQRDQDTNAPPDNKDDGKDESVGVASSPTSCGPMSDLESPKKHIRGPGDENDYETPIRSPKPSRWDPNKVVKNVKWDRALARSISEYAAEQLTRVANATAEAEVDRKGCLARDPAIFRLDPLGNVPDANAPLEDLGRERIVVTRFVYDDDVEAARPAKRRKT